MKHYILRHIKEYLLLLVVLLLLLTLLFSTFNPFWQGLLCASIVFVYVLWGFWHHYREKNLTGQIVMEYLLVALVILAVLLAFVS